VKIVHINTYDFGGAFVAAYRFHQEMCRQGIDSKFLVLKKTGKYSDVIQYISSPRSVLIKINESIRYRIINAFFSIIKLFAPDNIGFISLPFTPYNINRMQIIRDADIIHLHFIANFISIRRINRLNIPTFWTLHDESPFRGIRHTIISKENYYDLEFLKWYKKFFVNKCNITFISPSHWMANKFNYQMGKYCLSANIIHNGIPENLYVSPKNLNHQPIIGFLIADSKDIVKGFNLFLLLLKKQMDRYRFLLAGNYESDKLPIHHNIKMFGYINSEKQLQSFFKEIDILVYTSIYDNFPNVILESLAQSTPVIAFDVCGIAEIIRDKTNGFLVEPFNLDKFRQKIEEVLDNNYLYKQLSISAFDTSRSQFSISKVSNTLVNIYRDKVMLLNQ
jgi:glycosyltransferase involved in cell wall biosynthesis